MRFLKFLAPALFYLLVPPWSSEKTNPRAPFDHWERLYGFDTAEDCEARKRELFPADSADAARDVSSAQHARLGTCARQMFEARCIDANDPRLAKQPRTRCRQSPRNCPFARGLHLWL